MIPRTVKEYRIKWQHERGNPMLMYLYNDEYNLIMTYRANELKANESKQD